MRFGITRQIIIIMFFVSQVIGQSGTVHDISFTHEGTTRSYLLYEPLAYTGQDSWPLVINYHGFGETALRWIDMVDMNACADTAGFLVVYPQGLMVYALALAMTSTGWLVPNDYFGDQDDVAFTDSLIDHIAISYSIDPTRIHTTGVSNGSTMAYHTAISLPERIASVAGVAGTMSFFQLDSLEVSVSMRVLMIHGTADPYFPVEGDQYHSAMYRTPAFWASNLGCGPDSTTYEIPDLVPGDSCTATLIEYVGCDAESQVFFLRIDNGGHNWPGSPFPPEWGCGNTCFDINGSELIWNFFDSDSFSINLDPAGVAEGSLSVSNIFALDHNYPNPFNPRTTISYDLPEPSDVTLTIYDITGRAITKLWYRQQPAGTYSIQWSGTDDSGNQVSTGVYFARLQAGDYSKTIKMVYLK